MLSSEIELPKIDMVTVPAGKFLMGITFENPKRAFYGAREHPQHEVDLPEYQIGRYPTTNEQYLPFVLDTGHTRPASWKQNNSFPDEMEQHPVSGIRWMDAWLYCAWLRHKTGKSYHLPTEAQWEKAASWNPIKEVKLKFPWGNQFDKSRCNVLASGNKQSTPVGTYSPNGDSPYGCADMIGNVDEWCNSIMARYPYNISDGREDFRAELMTGILRRVTRGADWYSTGEPSPSRRNAPSDTWRRLWGFRVALDSSLVEALILHQEMITAAVAEQNKMYQDKTNLDPLNAQLWFERGAVRIKLQNFGIDLWKQIEADNTRCLKIVAERGDDTLSSPIAWVYYNRALARHHLSDLKNARSDIDMAIQLDPTDSEAYLLRAQICAELGILEQTQRDVDRLTHVKADHPQVTLIFARLYAHVGEHEKAFEMYSSLIEKPLLFAQPVPKLYLWRGKLHELQGHKEKAMIDYHHYQLITSRLPNTNPSQQ